MCIRDSALGVQIPDGTAEWIGGRVDQAGGIEINYVLKPGIEVGRRCLQKAMQECLVHAGIEADGMFRLEARIAINGIAENGIETRAEPFIERRSAVPTADVRVKFGSRCAERVRGGTIAGKCGSRRWKCDPLICLLYTSRCV